jgi:hypothetical protein
VSEEHKTVAKNKKGADFDGTSEGLFIISKIGFSR